MPSKNLISAVFTSLKSSSCQSFLQRLARASIELEKCVLDGKFSLESANERDIFTIAQDFEL